MLLRISLIVAIIAGLAVGIVNFITVKEKVTKLKTDLENTRSELATTQTQLSKANSDLTEAKTELTQTKETLETTTKERDAAVSEATAQSRRATQLAEELTKTKKDRDDAQAEPAAYKATGFSPADVLSLGRTLKTAQDNMAAVQEENRLLGRKIEKLEYQLAKYTGTPPIVFLPAKLTGKILISDPKWDFVVLDIGEAQGVKQDGELLVNRDGRLVAKVIVRSIQKDRCIANVLPGWKLGEVMEGDLVIPAHPESS